MDAQAIGITKGPGETPQEYTFITPDPQQRVKHGEFVYYEAEVEGARRQILGRVSGRAPLRLYPDTFLADPTVPPQAVADLLGYDQGLPELMEITVTILGYYDPVMGFVNPRVPPRSGAPIYIAPDEMLAQVLCRRRLEDSGAVHIGSLLSRPAGRVPIVLDARGFTSTHLAIIASTGAGKSYLAGVILEELMAPYNRAAVLVVDPHAEYDTLVELQNDAFFSGASYQPQVKIVRPNDIKVRVGSLSLSDLRYLLPDLTEPMHFLLQNVFGSVKRKYGDKWTRAQFRAAIRSKGKEQTVTDPETDEELEKDPTMGALLRRFDGVIEHSKIFDDNRSLPLEDLFKPGQCTVLQLIEIPEREQRVIVATLLRRLDQARRETLRGQAGPGDENYLPYPAFVLIEEAHNFAPANADIITTGILKQILSEGRKFGLAVGLISQRPGKLDSDVLSQCMTQCILRIVNPVDQHQVAGSIESLGRDLLNELPALSKGQVIVAGASVNTPVLVQVRQRRTPHGAENPDAPKEWLDYFDEAARRQRERDNALPADTPRKRGRERLYL